VILFLEFDRFVRQIFTDARGLWIIEGNLDLHHIKSNTPDALDKAHGIGMCMARVIQPGFVVKTGDVNDQAISLPAANQFSHPGGSRILGTAFTKPWTAKKAFKLRPEWTIAECGCGHNFFNKDVMEISE